MKQESGYPVILDGGMGRELKRIGAPFKQPEWSALALIEAPQFVSQVHDNFLAAGADVITTNTYALVPFHIGEQRFHESGRSLIRLAARLARNSANAYPNAAVAGCIPPVLGSYRADLFSAAQAQPIIDALIEHQQEEVDFWLAETVSSIAEAELISRRAMPTGKPLWMAFTIRDETDAEPRLRSGETVFEAVRKMDKSQLSAILFNCSCAEVMEQAIRTARLALADEGAGQHIRLGVYANSFQPIGENHQANAGCHSLRDDLTPRTYREFAKAWLEAGASIIGGCCGIGPEHIRELAALKKGISAKP